MEGVVKILLLDLTRPLACFGVAKFSSFRTKSEEMPRGVLTAGVADSSFSFFSSNFARHSLESL